MESVGRLAGGVAHDFNNLLTAIMGYTELAGANLSEDSVTRQYLNNVQSAAQRAAELTRQLLAFARKQIIEPKVINVNDVLLDMHRILRRLIGEDIELVTLQAPDLGLVSVDGAQLEQVIINLAVNARDAMPSGGKLTMETDSVFLDEEYAKRHAEVVPGEYVLFAISDTGEGMTDEVKAHLFEPFYTTKEMGKGTGLGLATCYGIVKQNGGHIWYYSELGHGTSFKVYLPRVWDKGEPLRTQQPIAAVGRGETILLVEDEPLVLDIAAETLKSLGYHVLTARTGSMGLATAGDYKDTIHLLITDVVMPQMSGKQIASQLSLRRPGMKVLYISGYTENSIFRRGELDEGVDFLSKPFTPAALAMKVGTVLDS